MGKKRGTKQFENMSLHEDQHQEETINKALKDAGLWEPGMDINEKQAMYKAVQQSSKDAEAQRTSEMPNRHEEDVPDNGDEHSNSGKEGSNQPDSPNTLITDDESSSECPADIQKRLPACTVSLVRCHSPQLTAGATIPPRGRGRGRAQKRVPRAPSPTTPGSSIRKPTNLNNIQSTQLQSAPSRLSLKSSTSAGNSPCSVKQDEDPCIFEEGITEQQEASPQSCYDNDAIERQIENETDLIPLADKDDDISDHELVTNEASSADTTMEGDSSPFLFEESPLAAMVSKFMETSCPDYLLQVKNVPRAKWLEAARTVALHLRTSRWDRIRNEDREWETITDFSKRAPSYSSLFSGSGSLRTSTARQAKQAPNYKCDDEDSDSEIFDQKFSRIKSIMKHQDEVEKVLQQPSPRNAFRIQEEASVGSGLSVNESPNPVGVHQKSDSKSSHAMESDSDSPGSPEADPVPDPYAYNENDWKTPNPRGKKRGGKRAEKGSDDDNWVPPTVKSATRGRGKKTRDNRVASGAIARPKKDQQSRVEPLNSANSGTNNHNENSNQNHEPCAEGVEIRPNKSQWTNTTTKQQVRLEIKPKNFFGNKPNQPNKQTHSIGAAGTSNTSASPDHDDDKPEVLYESPTKNVEKRSCPICMRLFPADEIENHASSCEAFPDAGQGDVEEEAEEGMGEEEEVEEANEPKDCANVDQPCHVCQKLVSLSEMDRHICKDRVTSPTIGHKRGSGDEGGPVKKCTRRLGLRGK